VSVASAPRAPLAPITPHPLLGVALILLMGACFATLDTTAKFLSLSLPVLVVLWVRYCFQGLAMALWLGALWLGGRGNLFRSHHPRFQLLRGALLLLTSALLFYGIQFMPVAEYTAVGMLTPVLVTVLAALFLKERVSRLRLLLICGGFAGALIVVRPGSGLFGWVALLPLAMALTYACYQLLTRRMSALEHPLTTHFYTGAVGALLASLVLWLSPVSTTDALAVLDARGWALVVLAGAMGTAGHLFLILAVARAPMALLMPFTYAQIGFASFTGWVAFGHVPDFWAVIGMAVVAICGAAAVALSFREASIAARVLNANSAAEQ
jgi:drug/metabolite transporter (DMT)-like permease